MDDGIEKNRKRPRRHDDCGGELISEEREKSVRTSEVVDPTEKLRAAILAYVEHLYEERKKTHTVKPEDIATLFALCRKAFSPETLRDGLSPMLPTLLDKLLPRIRDAGAREHAYRELETLSDHVSWLQPMVHYGISQLVSKPNVFLEYEDFARALRAIAEGAWTLDIHQLQHILCSAQFVETLKRSEPETLAKVLELHAAYIRSLTA